LPILNLRRIHNIIETKTASFAEVFHAIYGHHTPEPTVVQGSDGKRQAEKWDAYVAEGDKAFLKTPHGTAQFVLTFLVASTMLHSSCSSTYERRYLTATILRDLVDQSLQTDVGRVCALPFGRVALPIVNGKVQQAKIALQSLTAGPSVIDWWNSVLASDLSLPSTTPVLNNPVL